MTTTSERVLSGWGRTAPSRALVTGPLDLSQLGDLIASSQAGGVLARGAGRSYGDAAQNGGGVVLDPVTASQIELEPERATVRASASVTFTELLARTVPAGLLPPVLPGTRHLTVGGAVAADVHGKNQHADGSISAWIDAIELLDGDGALRLIHPGTPAFRATVGGMGLTGVIVSVRLRLLRIRSARLRVTTRRLGDLDALLAAQDQPGARYAVSWVDLSATGRSLGRGVLDTGDHLTYPDPVLEADGLHYRPGRPWPAPALPFCPVTTWSARAFNQLWFRASPHGRTSETGIPAYFHRLDAVRDWNRTLGPAGFRQYQFVVPLGAEKMLAHVITELQRHRAAAFLGTLKRFGPASGNYLSFPLPGWSLAVDMPAGRPDLDLLLDDLDRRVAETGGRVYLCKDSRLSRDAFAAMYGSDLDSWRAARAALDPASSFRSDLGRRLGLVDL
jgi:decaprenylphospho-beta-D-ribofuranose 2-oxidase